MTSKDEIAGPFSSVLVANRGEIAVRIIRAAKDRGLRSIAVASEADAGALFARHADQVVVIGPGPAEQSYLDADRIIGAALQTGAEAIHPGYGFLSENPDFARKVRDAGLVFIGPRSQTIEELGDKATARALALSAGVPCLPSYENKSAGEDELALEAAQIGFPIMIKAVAGGGGRGIRRVDDRSEFSSALSEVRAEASKAFGSLDVILEKYLSDARHVEVQVGGDVYGNIFHIGERDCSLQRRHQKLIEESPSPICGESLRRDLCVSALRIAEIAGYVGLGTVEFLVGEDGEYFFIEMNPRLQVEHPVTEQVYDVDLVGLQFDIARGCAVTETWSNTPKCHVMEARLFAEDPQEDFRPEIGHIKHWHPSTAKGIRIDHGIEVGAQVSPYYDAMIAKLIATGKTREEARQRLLGALTSTRVLGVRTNAAYLSSILKEEAFIKGEYTTDYLQKFSWKASYSRSDTCIAACSLLSLCLRSYEPTIGALPNLQTFLARSQGVSFQLDDQETNVLIEPRDENYSISWDSQDFDVCLIQLTTERIRLRVNGVEESFYYVYDGTVIYIWSDGQQLSCRSFQPAQRLAEQLKKASFDRHTDTRVLAPLGGVVSNLLVAENENIECGQCMLTIEAMKMVHEVCSPKTGVVTSIFGKVGDLVNRNDLLLEIAQNSPSD